MPSDIEDSPATAPGDPAAIYTGLVAELYAPLRGSIPDPDVYERFIRSAGEPALELGCGDGDPLLALRQRGLDVEGLDIRRHLGADGRALVPLFVPSPVDPEALGAPKEAILDGGDPISCTTVSVARDDATRTQVARLRYVRDGAAGRSEVERDWLLHWFSPSQFAELAEQAGLAVRSCSDWDGSPATDSSTGFAVTLVPATSGPSSC